MTGIEKATFQRDCVVALWREGEEGEGKLKSETKPEKVSVSKTGKPERDFHPRCLLFFSKLVFQYKTQV
jgi:hypothetical protein